MLTVFKETTMSKKLSPDTLLSLESYSKQRDSFRTKVMAHKKNRRVEIGQHANLYFEDYLTMQYQVQEMLRIERIFEAEGIEEELSTYNPLIPDGRNWKATFMVEYTDVAERQAALAKLIGIERHVWVQVEDGERIRPIANEDLERETEEKTSAVHFLRFELNEAQAAEVKAGANISMGIDHAEYNHTYAPIADNIRACLADDLA
jgi:hypothetical protein